VSDQLETFRSDAGTETRDRPSRASASNVYRGETLRSLPERCARGPKSRMMAGVRRAVILSAVKGIETGFALGEAPLTQGLCLRIGRGFPYRPERVRGGK
jgi:hypothetical protein